MLTTQRKIEIANAMISTANVGKHNCFGDPVTLCTALSELSRSRHISLKEENDVYLCLKDYYKEINGIKRIAVKFWFFTASERIEFIQKYIEHLKQQENE